MCAQNVENDSYVITLPLHTLYAYRVCWLCAAGEITEHVNQFPFHNVI